MEPMLPLTVGGGCPFAPRPVEPSARPYRGWPSVAVACPLGTRCVKGAVPRPPRSLPLVGVAWSHCGQNAAAGTLNPRRGGNRNIQR